jgi:protein farnesyltransferase subunit beta
VIGKICNLERIEPKLYEKVDERILSCQNYEGGFGAQPFNEAHGGYTYCGMAALKLLGKENMCNMNLLTYWLVKKQMKYEGGFQGRTNKLVDSCYSFWQGGVFPIIHASLEKESAYLRNSKTWLFDVNMLQSYLLICCQLKDQGGLVDTPGKKQDFYHTCYGLSGLSISQHFDDCVYNIFENKALEKIDTIYNLGPELILNAMAFFNKNFS